MATRQAAIEAGIRRYSRLLDRVMRIRLVVVLGAVATLVAVYPANLQMAVDVGRPREVTEWAVWLRLPLQFPLITWAHHQTR